jgi:hypothetical protein
MQVARSPDKAMPVDANSIKATKARGRILRGPIIHRQCSVYFSGNFLMKIAVPSVLPPLRAVTVNW